MGQDRHAEEILAKLELARDYSKQKASACYQAGLRATAAAGYQLFKKRDIASLAILNGMIQGKPVELTLTVPLGAPTRVVLSLNSDAGDDPFLKAEGARIFDLLDKELGR